MLSLQVYEILVMETRPGQAISIIECDMQVSPQASLMHGVTFVVENRLFIEHRILMSFIPFSVMHSYEPPSTVRSSESC